jgi:hypothetical protein
MFRSSLTRRELLAAGTAWFCSGCGYIIGNGFRQEIRTVHVPIFENDSLRRGYEYQLTEAVQKQIQLRSPYRLVNSDEADTVLKGRIISIQKNVLGENRFDDPRELQVSFRVHVTWEDRRSGQVLIEDELPFTQTPSPVTVNGELAPEVGQSLATATQDAVARMARRIVGMMESPW